MPHRVRKQDGDTYGTRRSGTARTSCSSSLTCPRSPTCS